MYLVPVTWDLRFAPACAHFLVCEIAEEERRYREFQIKSGLLPEPGTDTSADAAPAAPDPKKKPKKEESDDQISFVLELEKKCVLWRLLLGRLRLLGGLRGINSLQEHVLSVWLV